jgi:processive 1,2-diacylglycerol beta-glucosyltransferase
MAHRKVAEAVGQSLRELDPPVSLDILPMHGYMDPLYVRLVDQGYMAMVEHAPTLFRVLYRLGKRRQFSQRVVGLLQSLYTGPRDRLARIIARDKPDALLSTHPTTTEVVSGAFRAHRFRRPLAVVVTDYDFHCFWLNRDVDLFFVGRQEIAEEMFQRGVPRDKVEVTGVPVDPSFAKAHDRDALERRLGLRGGRFRVLLMGGGHGIGRVERLVDLFGRSQLPIEVLVVAGTNEALYHRLRVKANGFSVPVRAYPFVNNIAELMSVSDVTVTKPGGLTVAESMACGLPSIISAPLPGQEEGNVTFLEREGAAVRASGSQQVLAAVEKLISSPERFARLQRNVRGLSRPNAGRDVARSIAGLLALRRRGKPASGTRVGSGDR